MALATLPGGRGRGPGRRPVRRLPRRAPLPGVRRQPDGAARRHPLAQLPRPLPRAAAVPLGHRRLGLHQAPHHRLPHPGLRPQRPQLLRLRAVRPLAHGRDQGALRGPEQRDDVALAELQVPLPGGGPGAGPARGQPPARAEPPAGRVRLQPDVRGARRGGRQPGRALQRHLLLQHAAVLLRRRLLRGRGLQELLVRVPQGSRGPGLRPGAQVQGRPGHLQEWRHLQEPRHRVHRVRLPGRLLGDVLRDPARGRGGQGVRLELRRGVQLHRGAARRDRSLSVLRGLEDRRAVRAAAGPVLHGEPQQDVHP
ncbi:hypothetical protein FOCC_FOCC013533, partial [Frankliniella occidentalis]